MTAKLSQRFYEKPGEDIANELLRWAFLFWVTTIGALYAFTRLRAPAVRLLSAPRASAGGSSGC